MVALVLLSGGVDSAVLLGLACAQHDRCYALSFDYGQRHLIELKAAAAIAKHYEVPHFTTKVPQINSTQCSLLSSCSEKVPKDRSMKELLDDEIPNTYVPARNTLFLALALQQAELIEASHIYMGANADDYTNYPDCRPEFFEAYQRVLAFSSRMAVEGNPPTIVTPFLEWNKETIICQGDVIRCPLEMTWSCYDPQEETHCGCCDSCFLRQKGFIAADVDDPTEYANSPLSKKKPVIQLV